MHNVLTHCVQPDSASLEDLSDLPNLKSLVAKSNLILETSLPPEIFHAELNVLDLSSNKLRAIPEHLEEAIGLLVLNLASNQIAEVPPATFVNLCDLMHLDLSNNQLESLPAQMRRLSNLRVMNISNNPLGFAQLRQLPSLSALKDTIRNLWFAFFESTNHWKPSDTGKFTKMSSLIFLYSDWPIQTIHTNVFEPL